MPTDPYLCAGCDRPSPACTCVQDGHCGTCGTDLGAAADLQRELEAENARLRERIATVERARHAHGVWAAHANGKAQPADVLFSALGDAIDETNQLRTRLATVERETADARRAPAEWFSYDATNGFEIHDTEDEAVRACDAAIDYQRDEARQHDGWDEDEAGSVCMGIVTRRARFVREDLVEEDPEYVGGDYELTEIAGAHRTDDPLPSAIAAAREEGRVDGLREAATRIDNDDTFDLTTELRSYINLDAMGRVARTQVIGIAEAAIAYAVKNLTKHAATLTRGDAAKEPK